MAVLVAVLFGIWDSSVQLVTARSPLSCLNVWLYSEKLLAFNKIPATTKADYDNNHGGFFIARLFLKAGFQRL